MRDLKDKTQFLECFQDPVCLFDTEARLLYVNRAYGDFFSQAPADLIGQDFLRFISAEARAAVVTHFQTYSTDAPAGSQEHEVVSDDGTARWMKWRNVAIEFDPDGNPVLFLGIGHDVTDLRNAEVRRAESDLRYETLFSESLNGIAVHEMVFADDGTPVDYVFLDVNPAFERLTGLNRGDLIGRRVRDVLPTIETLWIERYGAVCRTGTPARFEAFAEALNRHFDVTAFSIAPNRFAVTFSDVSEQKAHEAAIRRAYEVAARQREELEVTLASIGDAVIVTDMDGVIWRMNPEAARLTGWPREDAEGRPVGEVLHLISSETRQPVRDPVARVLSEGVTVGLANHTALIARDGREYQIADSAAPIRDTSKDDATSPPRGVVMVFRDVTETYRMQAALVEQTRNFQMAVSASGAGVWDWNVRTNRMVRSGDFFTLLGLDDGAAIEGPMSDEFAAMIPPEDRAPISEKLEYSLETGEEYNHTFRVVRPDGQTRWLRSRGRVTERDDAGPIRMSGTVQDITDLQTLLLALQRSNSDLERFAYVASHDLQEPIRNLVAYSQLLGQRYADRLDGDADEFLAYIVGGAKRMQALVLDLLEYSRVSSRGQVFASVDLNAIVKVAASNLDQAIRDAGARIAVGALPVVTADEAQILSLFQNLMSNALKFRRAGIVPDITISAQRGTDGWELSVADNGIGIDPPYRDRIFEPFKRLHSSEQYSGTGIGLAIAKRIVEHHGGAIHVESTPGQGSRFVITLPDVPIGVGDSA